MELYYIIAVTDADRGEVMNALFREAGLPMILSMPGRGTAKNEHLAVYGLGETPKTVTCAVAGAQQAIVQPGFRIGVVVLRRMIEIQRGLRDFLFIVDLPLRHEAAVAQKAQQHCADD